MVALCCAKAIVDLSKSRFQVFLLGVFPKIGYFKSATFGVEEFVQLTRFDATAILCQPFLNLNTKHKTPVHWWFYWIIRTNKYRSYYMTIDYTNSYNHNPLGKSPSPKGRTSQSPHAKACARRSAHWHQRACGSGCSWSNGSSKRHVGQRLSWFQQQTWGLYPLVI